MIGSGNQSYMDRLYVLPRTGGRVLSKKLQILSEDDQTEVAVYWFLLNCRQHDERSAASETSDTLSALSPLTSEFDRSSDRDGLGRELLERIADHLPGSWERLGGAPEVYRRTMVYGWMPSEPNFDERRRAILRAVEHARTLLMQQEQPRQQQQAKSPAPGEPKTPNEQSDPGLGHNSKDGTILSSDQSKELDTDLGKIDASTRLGNREGDQAAKTTIEKIAPVKNILGESISTGIKQGIMLQGSKIIGAEIVKNTGLHWDFQYIGDLISSLLTGTFT